ncbi:oxidoreductase domain-containing protein [Gigaspora margarita]|uniref:Oxidoreductase domain-containing protein n=1 Tax=Gigaspora margarita TaxID=4874 RepID=A0A8H4AG61_GIGMA|nr:oxidoreductase domain-containing protein [Gigaspora margarita]
MSWIPAFSDKTEHPVSIVNLLKSKQATPLPPPRPITISIVGAGQRGSGYAYYTKIEPQWAKVVAVAEPIELRRNKMAKSYNIPKENVFTDWLEMIKRPKLSDAVVIATLDELHVEPTVAFANKKYNILLEKPMAITIEGCKKITNAVLENEVIFAVGHVLRYTPHNILVKSIIDSGFLGNIINIQHMEPVGFWHFAHSYVRGNWRKEEESCFSLMTKCCHDIDLISYWNSSPCVKTSSFGNLVYFNSKNKPKEAGDARVVSWPISVVTDIVDIENLTHALKNGPYGRCVYECDNDVADNQVVNLEFANGSTANITMIACTETVCKRKTKIFGSLGEIECDGINTIMYCNFLTRKKEMLKPADILGFKDLSGHGGGDLALMRAFIYSIGESLFALKDINSLRITSGVQQTFDSHLFVFAAEHSRKTGKTINIQEFKEMWGINS